MGLEVLGDRMEETMRKITLNETINEFNKILKSAKRPQKSLELLNDGRIIARNRFGKVTDSWILSEDADPIVLIRDVCKMLTGEM